MDVAVKANSSIATSATQSIDPNGVSFELGSIIAAVVACCLFLFVLQCHRQKRLHQQHPMMTAMKTNVLISKFEKTTTMRSFQVTPSDRHLLQVKLLSSQEKMSSAESIKCGHRLQIDVLRLEDFQLLRVTATM
ncbi:hypothetical protein Ae201684_008012 [Aphanomyces euteiches]|uniref:Uncharacterized protein n=1 Tax=Aphanomyces euteiches TaxID=100861 RepID=A0A6G0X6H1_9STRA|nr:hypothetical protein Ae201684_008012 [Aphanomyces euteiches]